MSHLADQAVVAFADGVLTGRPRERAAQHVAECAECAHAVAVQRHAMWALRAAPAPSLPSGLLDRLRDVPVSTPVRSPQPVVVDDQGQTMFAAFGMSSALVPAPEAHPRSRRKPLIATAAAVAVAGAVAVGSTGGDSNVRVPTPSTVRQGVVDRPALFAVTERP